MKIRSNLRSIENKNILHLQNYLINITQLRDIERNQQLKDIYMYLINNNFINNLEDLLVEESEEQMEEIILTLNYGGLFGINNINNYLQNKNNNKLYVFGFKKFKKGDPVLFYKDKDNYIIPQYTKGKILNIYISENETIYFDIELSITIDLVENSPEVDNIQILKSTIYKNAKNTVVKITTKYNNEEPNKLHLPFE
ncbi:hypothetical protein [Mesomycoplasma hyorhinis]|nr:hypothetical protein [Mesomycoplasma hyorhinis]